MQHLLGDSVKYIKRLAMCDTVVASHTYTSIHSCAGMNIVKLQVHIGIDSQRVVY